ncbi:hypothetical protein N1851_021630 [Merluccius polli]|uniref:Uncharacterized protein n=1 Tax=Merluccius polli TaxID=89951 RepID=A0AA47MJU0_MERPO|nr:hypothetical protein N1851_021630 [Merluccius polli]
MPQSSRREQTPLGPSCVSMRRRLQQEERQTPLDPSCVSMKSDWSMEHPPQFKDGNQSIEKRRRQQERADSPGPSCVSMKSDWSMEHLLNLKMEISLLRREESRTRYPDPCRHEERLVDR